MAIPRSLKGKYSESDPGTPTRSLVRLVGKFRLTHESATAFEHRPLQLSKMYIAAAPLQSTIRLESNTGETIKVQQQILIDRLVVILAHDIPDAKLIATLDGPNGKKVILHSGQKVGSMNRVIFDSSDSPSDPLKFLSPPEFAASGAALNGKQNRDRGDTALRETIGQNVIRRPRESLSSAFRDSDASGEWETHGLHLGRCLARKCSRVESAYLRRPNRNN